MRKFSLVGYSRMLNPDDLLMLLLALFYPLVTYMTLVLFLQTVRMALSNACMKLAPKLGQEHTMTHILPMLLAFLRDDSAEVSVRILVRFEPGTWENTHGHEQH